MALDFGSLSSLHGNFLTEEAIAFEPSSADGPVLKMGEVSLQLEDFTPFTPHVNGRFILNALLANTEGRLETADFFELGFRSDAASKDSRKGMFRMGAESFITRLNQDGVKVIEKKVPPSGYRRTIISLVHNLQVVRVEESEIIVPSKTKKSPNLVVRASKDGTEHGNNDSMMRPIEIDSKYMRRRGYTWLIEDLQREPDATIR